MRLVLDTNTAVSGLLWHGNPGKLIERDVLHREKFAKPLAALGLTPTEIFEGYAALAAVVVPAIIPPTIVDDPDDDAVLARAVAAEADYMVSGDPHLLKLEQFRNIPILTPTQAVEQLAV